MNVEFTPEQRRGRVFAGVDTHARTHWLCVLGEYGEVKLSKEFPATAEGYDLLAASIGDPASCVAVGVEGTASYGAGLTRRLAELGFTVYEVLRPKRASRRRGQPKNDASDAERAARDAMGGCGLSIPKAQDGWVERLRRLQEARDCLVCACTALCNTARCLITTAPEDVRRHLSGMGTVALMSSLADGACPSEPALAAIGKAWASSRREQAPIEKRMESLIRENCPALLSIYGCSVVCAAKLAVAVGDNPERIGSEAAMAALFGTSPIEASSGETRRHRLNRGGNRSANAALHQIVVTRMKSDPRTRAYVERRCGGAPAPHKKSKKEAMRCLQRYVVREVYHALNHPFDVASQAEIAELRKARKAAGLVQKDVAKALGTSVDAICRLETGSRPYRELAAKYRAWVEEGMPIDVQS